MGLSSSQGRLLMLTSRLNDIELQEVMISQRQNKLAWQSEAAASDYNEALSNYKLQIKVTDPEANTGFKTEDLTYSNMTSMGYLATNSDNEIYLEKDENGEWIIPKNLDGKELLSISENGKARLGDKEYNIIDGSKMLSNSQVLQNYIKNGAVFLINTENSQDGISMDILQSDTKMEYVLDTSDDAEALSKYEYETAAVSRSDNQLDLELQQLETQHAAVLKEYDSVKEVINNNVDRTFNLFSQG